MAHATSKEITYQIGDKVQKLSPSGTEVLAEGVVELQKRIERDNEAKSLTEIKLDGSNEVAFPGFPYLFEALGDKVLVSIDIFRSGYECRECKGTKMIKYMCTCEKGGHAGLKYGEDELKTIAATLGEDIALARTNMICPDCNGSYEEQRSETECTACHGIGHTVIIPDTSKKLPTTGVVVSMGSQCNKKELGYDIGDRILFGPYAGNAIPTKAGLMFKIIDGSQAWCRIKGGENLAAFDFVIQDKD